MATPTYAGIQGRVFSVTGGTSGMGHATVRLLASNGAAEVWVADWNVSRGDEIIAEMATVNPNTKVHITKVDVSDSKQVDAWVSSIVAATGGLLHGCANVAGLPQNPSMEAGPALLQQDDDSWAKVLGVNLSGVMYCTRAQVREMIKMPKGSHQSIVNVSSMASLIHGPGGMYAYTASKAGCAHFTTCVAKDVYPYGIRANTVSPGNTLTPMTKEFFKGLDEEAIRATMEGVGLPVKPMGPADIARSVVWLLSESSLDVNGVNLPVGEGAP